MIKSIAHVAVSTLDLERSRAFYEQLLGLSVVADFYLDDRGIDNVVQIDNARLHILMLATPDDPSGAVVELTHYETPKGKPMPADFRYNNVGVTHICFWVDDVDADYQRLSKAGVVFNSEPQTVDVKGIGTVKAAYFRDPDNNSLELLQVC